MALALFVVPLAGCATLQDVVNVIGTVAQTKIVNPVSDQRVMQIGNALGTANAAVVGHAALTLCPAGHALTAPRRAAVIAEVPRAHAGPLCHGVIGVASWYGAFGPAHR